MDGELAYWQALSGLGTTTDGISAHKRAYLTARNGGVTDDIQSLFSKLYGGELAYWRTIANGPTLSFSHAKYNAVNGIGTTSHISIFRSELVSP